MIRIFAGFDPREEVGYHTFVSSVLHNTRSPLSISPVAGVQFDGTNAFTYARFHVPKMCGNRGWALFVDGSDMIVKADLDDLWSLRDYRYAVQVVQHDYQTIHPRKYIGTGMEAQNGDYPRKNWSSVMLINCEAPEWLDMLPGQDGAYYHRFEFIDDHRIGSLPVGWNWLVDEFGPNPDAMLLHWTAGIPAFPRYAQAPHADEWALAATKVTHATS